MTKTGENFLSRKITALVLMELDGNHPPERGDLLAWLQLASVELERLTAMLSLRPPLGYVAPEVAPAAAAAPVPRHKHVFDRAVGSLCLVELPNGKICGAEKKANGRPRKEPAGVPVPAPKSETRDLEDVIS